MAAPRKPLDVGFLTFLQKRRPEYLLQIGIIDKDRLTATVDGLLLKIERKQIPQCEIHTTIERLLAEVAGGKAQQLLRRRYAEWKHEQINRTAMIRVKPETRDLLLMIMKAERFDSMDELLHFLARQHAHEQTSGTTDGDQQ